MTSAKNLKERYRRFKVWQQQPFQVAPMSDEEHSCPTCGTHYVGNFCPRCGQSAKNRRYSLKGNTMLFLEDWGFGNRSFLRTVRDLILRPGYMIRDYLHGMFMAYFPPFKMLLLLAALTLLVYSGFNIRRQDLIQKEQVELQEIFDEKETEKDKSLQADAHATASDNSSMSEEKKKRYHDLMSTMYREGFKLVYRYYSIATLIGILLTSIPLFWLFRRSPQMKDINYSEFFIAIIYCENMTTIYTIASTFLCIDTYAQYVIQLLPVIPLRQLSGYAYWQTLLRYIAAYAITLSVAFVAILLGIAGIAVYVYLS